MTGSYPLREQVSLKPEWIIFDIGGVLLDWHSGTQVSADDLGVSYDQFVAALFDKTVDKSIGMQMNLGEISPETGWNMVLQKLHRHGDPQALLTWWHDKKFWITDSLKLITELHKAEYKLAIMSNSWLGLTDPVQRQFFPPELNLFDKIFDSSIEHLRKPCIEFYALVEDRVNASGSALLLIDDLEKNLLPAASRGWQTFHYDLGAAYNGMQANGELRLRLLVQK